MSREKNLVVFANHDSLFGIYLASHMEICGCNNLEGCNTMHNLPQPCDDLIRL